VATEAYPLDLEEEYLSAEEVPRFSDQRAELMLGALVVAVIGLLVAMIVFVFVRGWPSFSHNGLSWFSANGSVDNQFQEIYQSGQTPGATPDYTFHAWPLLWSTMLVTGLAVSIAFVSSLFVSVFIVEFAPEWMRNILQPVVRLLASVPSVVYGLIGVLVLVPFVGNHLITESSKASVDHIVSLTGYGLATAVVILTVMIAPLMISIFCDGLNAVRKSWLEGSLAAGINRWRTFWKIAVRTARPALVAGTVIATARAIGEAIMLAMVSGGVGFAPNPFDGAIFLVEPSRPFAPMIITNIDGLTTAPSKATLFAIASVLLLSAMMLSLAGWVARQSMKKYTAHV
jgi:ABC-type phosphate transport system permease subunit